ncbi:MAG: hypothetical protein L0K86_25845, partial [Actinomycetia bacterium]|nr:hypothetical protein [Actinomycetes bacterium]
MRATAGRQLGARCPELADRRPGRWAFAVDLPTIDGQRTTLRRCGFRAMAQVHAALHRVLACERAGIHVVDRQTVAGFVSSHEMPPFGPSGRQDLNLRPLDPQSSA